MEHEPILSLRELKTKFRPIVNVNVEHKRSLTPMDRLAVWVTEHIGSMGFFLVIAFWTCLWLGWNVFAPRDVQFDPYPAFVLWLFISNVLQIMILPLIMVGQNILSRHAEARAEADFHLNIKAEKEIETILLRLEHQHEVLKRVLDKIETAEAKQQ